MKSKTKPINNSEAQKCCKILSQQTKPLMQEEKLTKTENRMFVESSEIKDKTADNILLEKPFNQIEGISYPNPNYNQQKYAPKNLDAMRETKCSRSEPTSDGKPVNVSENQPADVIIADDEKSSVGNFKDLNSQIEETKKGCGFVGWCGRRRDINEKPQDKYCEVCQAKLQTLKQAKQVFENAFEKLKRKTIISSGIKPFIYAEEIDKIKGEVMGNERFK